MDDAPPPTDPSFVGDVAAATFVTDQNGRLTSWGANAERATGCSAVDVLGRSFVELAAADDEEAARAALLRALSGETVSLTLQWRRRDGFGPTSISLAPICDERGLVIGARGTPRGLETRRDDAGDDSVQVAGPAPIPLAAKVLAGLPDALLVVGLHGGGLAVSFANRRACELFVWPTAPTAEGPLVLQKEGHPLGAVVEGLVRSGRAEQEVAAALSDGRETRLVISVTPLDDEAPGTSLVQLRDVTSDRVHEESRSQAEKMDAIGRLAGGVAHEFNNMLTAIGGFSDLLLEELTAADPKRGDVLQIKEAADRATALTRELLAFSARQVLQPQSVDLSTLIARARSGLQGLLGPRSELDLDLAAESACVHADVTQLEHVLSHLIANARDAMPAGGKVTIATRLLDAEAPRPSTIPDGRGVVMTVTDTGVGMDRVAAAKAFEPFFSTKASRSGGLGLSSVYGIVRQSGGHIAVESRVGTGTTFRVHFPATAEVAAPASRTSMISPSRTRETILLLEDEDVVRSLATHLLRRQGYCVLDAADGEAGLALASSFGGHIDLLLTDIVMPGCGGVDVARRLSAERPTMRVLFMSGYTEDSELLRGLRDARVAFLAKPFTPDVLERRVRDVLDGEDAILDLSWAAGSR